MGSNSACVAAKANMQLQAFAQNEKKKLALPSDNKRRLIKIDTPIVYENRVFKVIGRNGKEKTL